MCVLLPAIIVSERCEQALARIIDRYIGESCPDGLPLGLFGVKFLAIWLIAKVSRARRAGVK